MDEAPTVDVKALHSALDAARTAKDLSWRQLAKELGVSASTISRMANGFRPDVTAFAAMTLWLKMPAEAFYRQRASDHDQTTEPELVASLVPLLRARKDLDDKDIDYLQEIIGAAAKRFEAEREARSWTQ
ncbi:helix-turn-helix domain-containing protein [Leifsonia sp. PS1209]|uniref:helix-turn-helix domain-containing protein n=1 Tax=Leifsonia sp. PS1209 TaxID=2724914 RepID=UPI001442D344|nr:helix-turn-helix domain-containing protein [Leifsonia sp. PS1209]QIZ99813.1 helix-turn-helix transcriptional regulator [Leifsonia sp. PS1209]